MHAQAGDGNGVPRSIARSSNPSGGPDGAMVAAAGTSSVVDPDVNSLLTCITTLINAQAVVNPVRAGIVAARRLTTSSCGVPPGTVVQTTRQPGSGRSVGSRWRVYVLAQGGRGGFGNAALATRRRKVPRIRAARRARRSGRRRAGTQDCRRRGPHRIPQRREVKSCVRALCGRPKVADYPFTTLTPHPESSPSPVPPSPWPTYPV